MAIKVKIRIGYTDYVMDLDKAIHVIEALAGAELYEAKFKPKAEGGTTHWIYPQDAVTDNNAETHITILNPGFYNLAKLAGKPPLG